MALPSEIGPVAGPNLSYPAILRVVAGWLGSTGRPEALP